MIINDEKMILSRADEEMNINNVIEEETSDIEVKKNPDILDMLLNSDPKKLNLKTKKVEIPRLSEALGTPFIITLKMLPVSLYEKITDGMGNIVFDEDGNPIFEDNSEEVKLKILIESCYVDGDKQLFKQSSLMRQFNVRSDKALVRVLLNPGEINKLYLRYRELAGFSKSSVEEVKN